MNKSVVKFNEWYDQYAGLSKRAGADTAPEVKDPTDKGTPSIPKHPEGDNRSALNLPTNQRNSNEGCLRDTNILSVTKPNGVGQGEYITPENGNAKDEAFTSPTTPLSKIAASFDQALAEVLRTAEAAPEKRAAAPQQNFDMPTSLSAEPGLLEKLASFGAVMIGTTEGQAALAEALEREAGIKEAHALIESVQADCLQEAMNLQALNEQQEKAASVQRPTQDSFYARRAAGHQANYDSFPTELEKQAYATGAADGAAMADAVEATGEPSIPGSDQLSDEDIMGVIQELVASGQVTEEEIAALIEQLAADGQPGGSLQEIAQALKMAVESGQLDPAAAEAIAQQILANDPEAQALAAEPAVAEGPEAAGMPSPEEAAAAADIAKTASVMNYLFNPRQ